MKHKIRNAAAIAALVAVSTLGLGSAAQAATIYPPSGACTVASNVASPNSRVAMECADGTFSPNERVTITVRGASSVSIGFFKFATTSTGTAQSSSTGSLSTGITFPTDASGVYEISATSETSTGGSATITVATDSEADGGGSLPVTGMESGELLGLWVGGGALVLAGGAIAVAASVRRNRAKVDA
ncbi:cell wall protein [Microbacterium thalassium]|uniref:Cell wall protein n=1 Tax=Microbacterium thalassium TaxID=362649 RepID=A0A7X0FP11_9MICO|nr:cell wall protein [Microbacterium thalassium]MBB6391055.1 hypothetical protein [Microbacterium thalassium]GLK23834.1 hypothetical protein GCM10017607_11520 [Microbacterium thalassium]